MRQISNNFSINFLSHDRFPIHSVVSVTFTHPFPPLPTPSHPSFPHPHPTLNPRPPSHSQSPTPIPLSIPHPHPTLNPPPPSHSQSPYPHSSPTPSAPSRVRLYDREEQAWTVESDVSMNNLLLRLFYDDVIHVPRGHVRRVTWALSIVPVIGQGDAGRMTGKNIGVGGVRLCYYVQLDADDGHTVVTNIPTAEVGGWMLTLGGGVWRER